jgi:pyridinium-3,5-biscarboxylic acid mononucleotide sulfurtransferase
VTPEKLQAIDRAETALRALGFRGCRVRHHDDVARLELARADIGRAIEPDTAAAISAAVKAAGFRYVAIDLDGYRTGSLNERIPLRVVD